MTTATTGPATRPALRETAARAAAAVAGVLAVNLAILGVARAAGADFTFTADGEKLTVGVFAVSFMTLVPLLSGLVLTALIGLRWPAVTRVALVVAPVLALGTIAGMTLPADFDTPSTIALSLMHLALVPAAVLAVLALRTRLLER